MIVKLNVLGDFGFDHKTESISMTVTDSMRRNKVKASPMIINWIDDSFNEVVTKWEKQIGCNVKYEFDGNFASLNEFERNKVYLKVLSKAYDAIHLQYPFSDLPGLKQVLAEVEDLMDYFEKEEKLKE